jgi:hypothetical protein
MKSFFVLAARLCGVCGILLALLSVAVPGSPSFSCSPVITAPTNGSTIKGVTTFTVNPQCPGGLNFFTRLYIDGTHFDFTGNSAPVDTTKIPNGSTGATVILWDSPTGTIKYGVSPNLNLTIANGMSTVTPTPTSSPTPTNVGTEVTINSPANGQTVSGKTVVVGVTLGPDVYWDQLQVDGNSVLSGSGNLTWNSTTVANGTHKLMVRAFQRGGTTPIGTAFISVVVNNLNATPTPAPPTPSHTPAPSSTPTPPTPSPTPTPVPLYFSTLSATASLPNETQCASMIPVTTETVPANTPFNQTLPTAAQLSAYAANGYTSTYQDDYTQYKRVDGQYSGSTDMIMRWAACKYGIDENIVRAQGWIESGRQQGGAGDMRTTQAQCVQGSFTALWNTTISEPGGSTVSCPNCCYQSWSLWQTKVYYEWMTWPEIMQSTAFAVDYRYADQRACMDGAYATYFASSGQQPNTYAADIANYKSNPDTTNTNRVLWGCIGMHFSGSWYDSGAQNYINAAQSAMLTQPWPH